jgi:hypothetical protein
MAAGRVADLRIGPVETRILPEEVEAYARATLGVPPPSGTVPATFPATWLWHPRAAAAVAEAAGGSGKMPVLTAQRFAYLAPLAVGATYRFTIERFREAGDPDAVELEAEVRDEKGRLVATFSAAFRLVAFASAEEAA